MRSVTAMAEPHASGPLCVADLDFAEQFVLWALRTPAGGRRQAK